MKIKTLFIISLIINAALCAVIISMFFINKSNSEHMGTLVNSSSNSMDVKSFSLEKYATLLAQLIPVKTNVGPVKDEQTAIKVTKELWQKEYGDYNKSIGYKSLWQEVLDNNEDTYLVEYDQANLCWHIVGIFPEKYIKSESDTEINIDEVPDALIRSNGDVIAILNG